MPTFHVTLNARPDALLNAAKNQGISVTVAIAKACAEAIAHHPSVNWAYQPVDKLVERSNIDIGMVVELGGLRILTDTVLRPHLAFLQRQVEPISPERYAGSDVVLISHLHWDHLDLPSLRRWARIRRS